jgi:hypothetical protein
VKTPQRPRDTNQLAKMIVGLSTRELHDEDPMAGKSASVVESGGGQKDEAARAAALLPAKRRAITEEGGRHTR